jgi:hypothetical protein
LKRILIIEPNLFLASEYARILSHAGMFVVQELSRDVDGIIISDEVVDNPDVLRLLELDIPYFLLLSKSRGDLAPRFRYAHSVTKPVTAQHLIGAAKSFL